MVTAKNQIGRTPVSQVKHFLKSTSPYANAVAALALTFWLVKALWLNDLPSAFPKAHELGDVVEITLSQIVASYVFYLFFVHWQETNERSRVAPYIQKHVTRVYGDCDGQLSEISRVSGHPLDFDTATLNDVRAAFIATPTSTHPNMMMGQFGPPATWFQYFLSQQDRTKDSIERVMQLGRLVSADLAKRLVDVSDCSFFGQMPTMVNIKMRNPTLEVWAGSFYDYLLLCRQVKEWVLRQR